MSRSPIKSPQEWDAFLDGLEACSALGELHVMRAEARLIERWHADKNFDIEESARKIAAYGLKAHVLLGGNPPATYGEALVMQDMPECEGHEYDNRTYSENREWLLAAWFPNAEIACADSLTS